MASLRHTAVGVYRKLFRRVVLLPVDRREGALSQLRSEFREHANVTDVAEISRLLLAANSKLAYLRMITPTPRVEKGQSTGTFVYRDGELQAGRGRDPGGARHSAYDGSNLDPEAVARHQRLIDRQHFGGRR